MTGGGECPVCGRPVELRTYRPFCSARCKQVDLGRWLGEVYRVPAPPDDTNGAEPHDDEQEE